MMNCCFCLVFVAWTWRSKSPCCQLQLWCNRPRIRLDPTTGGMQATRQIPPLNRVCVCVCVWENESTALKIPLLYMESDLYNGSEKQKVKHKAQESRATHSIQPQSQYGSHMMRNNAIVQRARWCLVPTDTSVESGEVQLPRVDRSDKFGLTPKTSVSLSLAKEISPWIDCSS